MTCSYSLQLLSVRGVPNDFGRAVLEVVVRTPRLLSTVRQKYASEPFPVQAARSVTVHWTQTKAAKAHIRLRLLPGNAPAPVTAAAAPARLEPSLAQAAGPASTGAAPATALDWACGLGQCKSAQALLQLHPELGSAPGPWPGQQAARLTLTLPLESGGGMGVAVPAAVLEIDLLVVADRGSGGGIAAAVMADGTAATPPGPAAASGTAAPHGWAWAEVASAPAAVGTQPGALRKRSWLLALGLGRHGGSGGGGNFFHRKNGSGGGAAAAALGGADSQATSVWDAVAALSSITDMTATSAATATAVTLSSSSLGARGALLAAPELGESGSWATRPPQPGCQGTLARSALTLQPSPFAPSSLAAASSDASVPTASIGTSAALQLQPPLSSPPPPPQQQLQKAAVATTAPSGCSDPQPPKRRRLGDFLARLFHPLSSHDQVRRIGGGVESSGASTRPAFPAYTTGAAAAALTAANCGSGACGSSATSVAAPPPRPAAVDAAAAPVASPAGDPGPGKLQPLRRLVSPLEITPLTPPIPRLGDVYRVQHNAHASDAGVQIGFGLGIADVADVSASATQPSSGLVPGLDSPGCGETSPAAGPDRLTLEPPVDDLAAASLASPMAISPDATAGGCFFWRYGAAARARAAQQAAGPAPPPPQPHPPIAATGAAACGLGWVGWAPVPGVRAPACEAPSGGSAGSQLTTTSARDARPAASSSSGSLGSCGGKAGQRHVAHAAAAQLQPQAQQQQQQLVMVGGQSPGGLAPPDSVGTAGVDAEVAAAIGGWSQPLAGEISRVAEFVGDLSGMSEDLRAVALSQCQFLFDCLRNPDMRWLVGDSLLQLKLEVGFPFDTGVPIPGAPGWFRLVMQPLHAQPPPPVGPGSAPGAAAAAAERAVSPPPTVSAALAAQEVLKVRWACIDQRQVGGTNACAAIGLEVAAWCLGAYQRWRQEVAAVSGSPVYGRRDAAVWPQPQPQAESAASGGGGGGRREVAAALSRPQRDRERERLVTLVELESMSSGALEACIREGTAVWQGVLLQSPAARVASSTGDFDLEHMLQLGGYSQRLKMAEYLAASLLEDGSGGSAAHSAALWRFSREDAAADAGPVFAAAAAASLPPPPPQQQQTHSAALAAAAAAAATSLLFPAPSEGKVGAEPEGRSDRRPPALQLASVAGSLQPCGSTVAVVDQPTLKCSRARQGSQCGVPTFATLVRSLQQGVYVLGWRGHFATLWLRPGGVVHLIDSLGARLAADCPLAFVLEFGAPSDFLAFFLARHRARRDAAAADDIAGGNAAALIEVHRLELAQPPQPQPHQQPQQPAAAAPPPPPPQRHH